MISITALLALWSASKGMLSICRGLNRIYQCKGRRGYFSSRIICTGYTLLFMAACILSLVLLVFRHCPAESGAADFSISGKSDQAHISFRSSAGSCSADRNFCRPLHLYSGSEAESTVPASRCDFFHRLLDRIFLCFLYLFQQFQQLLLHVRKSYCIVLLMLWLYFCILHPLSGC